MKKFLSSMISAVIACSALSAPVCRAEENSYFPEEQPESVVSAFETLPFDTVDIKANYSEGSYNYGNFLDENNVQVYMEMMKLINPSTEKVRIKLPVTKKFTVSTLDTSRMSDEDILTYSEALFSSCRPGIDAALFDIPELFWIDLGHMGVNISDYRSSYNFFTRKYTVEMTEISFTPVYYENYGSLEGVMEYKEKLTEAVENFPVTGETRYEQLKSIHDYICTNTFYDADSPFYSSAVGAIVEPGAVCEAYSEGFKIICDSLKIPCVLVVGNFNSTNDEAHMWNYVQMEDGNWYAVDVTWDDLDGDGGKELKYQYFLKGSDSFFIAHTPSEELGITKFTYPELSAKDYSPGQSESTTTTTTVTTTTTKTSTTTASSTSTKSTKSTTSTTSTKSKTSTTSTTTATSTSTTTATTTYAVGDVNHDGNVNAADLVYCTRTVLVIHKPEFSCDVNGDGTTDAFDVLYIRKLLLGLI